jgi:hypothetical protein
MRPILPAGPPKCGYGNSDMRRATYIFYIVVGLLTAYIVTACVVSRQAAPLEARFSQLVDQSGKGAYGGKAKLEETPGIEQEKPAEKIKPKKFTAQQVFAAMQAAYPDRVQEAAFKNGEWAARIDDTWYYWAEGRLLPEKLLDQKDSYNSYPFYKYPKKLPPIEKLSEKEKAEIKDRLAERELNPSSRYPGFYKALWRIEDRAASWERVKTTYFLGLKTQIHRDLLEDLAKVEEEILKKAKSDEELKAFVDSIVDLAGYNWRRIAGTASLSFHSFGTALDILPRSYGGKQAYWRWARTSYPDWFILPYAERFFIPESFVAAFEKYGFIWGGKWFYFDNIHFEYRPEILILNGFEPPSMSGTVPLESVTSAAARE